MGRVGAVARHRALRRLVLMADVAMIRGWAWVSVLLDVAQIVQKLTEGVMVW